MLLNVQELCVSYLTKKTELKAVDHVSFGIERGDTLGIIGESGSGKSTIVMAMLRQLDPRFSKITGRVEFDGQELLTLPDAEFKKLLWKRHRVPEIHEQPESGASAGQPVRGYLPGA